MTIENNLQRIADSLERIERVLGVPNTARLSPPVTGDGTGASLPPISTSQPNVQRVAGAVSQIGTEVTREPSQTAAEFAAGRTSHYKGETVQAATGAAVPHTAPATPAADPMADFVTGVQTSTGAAPVTSPPAEEAKPKKGRGPNKPKEGDAPSNPPPGAAEKPATEKQVPKEALKDDMSLDQLRVFLSSHARRTTMAKVQEAIASFGVASVMALDKAKYPDLRTKVEAIT